jgi:hypothetical protein
LVSKIFSDYDAKTGLPRIARSSRKMEHHPKAGPVSSNTPGPPRAETDPCFSSEIHPGPNEKTDRQRRAMPIFSEDL